MKDMTTGDSAKVVKRTAKCSYMDDLINGDE